MHTKRRISEEAAARYELLKRRGLKGTDLDQSYEALMKRLTEKHWKEFAEKHPEKAEHFAKEEYKNIDFSKAESLVIEIQKMLHTMIVKM